MLPAWLLRLWHMCLPPLLCSAAADGRGFHLLGAVMWAPLCGGLHWLNSSLRPAAALKAFLVSQDLLDLPQHEAHALAAEQQKQQLQEQQQEHEQQQALEQQQARTRFEDMSWRDKAKAVEAIKQRELQQLHKAMRRQEEEQEGAAAAAAAGVLGAAAATSRSWRLW
jgi:hypothetical protein